MSEHEILREARSRELEQALFYRTLAGLAEDDGDGPLAERLNELLADEQHHVSRLTARLLELGQSPGGTRPEAPQVYLDGWLGEAETREAAEVAWYEDALARVEDSATAGVLREILESERNHLHALGGKWMSASAQPTENDA